MAVELRFTVADWEAPRAVDLVMGLPLLMCSEVETEYLGVRQEDRETGPDAEGSCHGRS